jgi:hypothetical protein
LPGRVASDLVGSLRRTTAARGCSALSLDRGCRYRRHRKPSKAQHDLGDLQWTHHRDRRSGQAKLPKDATVEDYQGKFIIPGLWDMHVHLSDMWSGVGPLFIANGVTGVRDMGGDLAIIDWMRENVSAGRLAYWWIDDQPILKFRSSPNFWVARHPGVPAIDSHQADLYLIWIQSSPRASARCHFARIV